MQTEGQLTPREPSSKRVVLAHLAEGVRVSGYVIERPLGAGGMGQVYLALDERLGRKVALKILPPDDADDEARSRFLREAKALARVEHPNVVRVFASGEDGDTAWMALEVIDGEPLSSLASGEPLDEETSCALMAQVARGLAAVHAVGVVHRDVKPENLLVDNDAVVKIVDFGVALLADAGSGGFTTRKGVVVGTPHFMSPEQARGASVDARSDAWAVGATLYSLLTARPPFYGDNDEPDLDILARVLREPVPDVLALAPATSSATRALLAALLEKDPERRPSEMATIAGQLDAIAAALARGESPGADPAVSPAVAAVDAPAVEVAVEVAVEAAPEGAAVEVAPAPQSVSLRRLAAVVAVPLLVAGAVVGGAALGQLFTEPNEVVTVIKVPVKVPVEVRVPVEVQAPPAVVDVPRTPEEIAAELTAAPAVRQAELVGQLLAKDDDDARAALALVAGGSSAAGDLIFARIDEDHRADLMGVVEAALFSPSVERAQSVVDFLANRRDDTALKLLRRAAEGHKSPVIRREAASARDSIFKVEP